MIKDPLHHIEQVTREANELMEVKTKSVFKKYPVTFSFLILFGVISVLHGFEAIIESLPYLNEHPVLLFVIGLLVLIFTGTLYKRLDKRLD